MSHQHLLGNLPSVDAWRRVETTKWDLDTLAPAYPGRRVDVVCAMCQKPVRYGSINLGLFVGCENSFSDGASTWFPACWDAAMTPEWCRQAAPKDLSARYSALLPLEDYVVLVDHSEGLRGYTAVEALVRGSHAYRVRAMRDLDERRAALIAWAASS